MMESRDLEESIVKLVKADNNSNKIIISVIIVTYNTTELKDCLKSLENQTFKDFEVIIVDNGVIGEEVFKAKLYPYPITLIKLRSNLGLSFGRNVGIVHARGMICCFLDDDSIPSKSYIDSIRNAFRDYDIIGLRGKVLPKDNRNLINKLAVYSDLGDEMFPFVINQEGNSAFLKDVLIKVGGFNKDLFGGEGLELTYRIINMFYNSNKLVYFPDAIIYHDFSRSLVHFLKKMYRHSSILTKFKKVSPDIYALVKTCDKSANRKITTKKEPEKIFDKILLICIEALGTAAWGIGKIKSLTLFYFKEYFF